MFRYRLLIILLFSNFLLSQILVDPIDKQESTLPLDNLIQKVLFSGCEQINNLKVKSGKPQGIKSYGYFEKGSSNFDFNKGIVLSTGDVSSISAPFDNNKENKTGEGNNLMDKWVGDSDLQKILNQQLGGDIQTYNSTSLEFDIVPLTNKISIDFIFGSNEYELNGDYECIDATTNFQDGFAFLISGPGITNDPGIDAKNVALIPGDNKAVGVGTIHNNNLCDNKGREDLYVEGATKSTINVNGYTVPLTALQDVTPGLTYRVKIVLGERGDGKYDSFIFLSGDGFSFNVDLGVDQVLCRGEMATLEAGNLGDSATYKWYKDGVEIEGEASSKLKVSKEGTYKVEAFLPGCSLTDEVQITIEDLPTPRNIIHEECSKERYRDFYLPSQKSKIIENHEDYKISFYKTLDDAEKNINPLPDTYTNEKPLVQIIYIRVENKNGCVGYSRYKMIIVPEPKYLRNNISMSQCDKNQDGKELFDLTVIKEEIINTFKVSVVTFYLTEKEAISGSNPLPLLYETKTRTIYAKYYSHEDCYRIKSISLNVILGYKIEPIKDSFCLDEGSNLVIDLTKYEKEMPVGSSWNIIYYETLSSAEEGINPIPNPSNYTLENDKILYQRIDVRNKVSCYTINSIELKVSNPPIVKNAYLTECKSNVDGVSTFSLTQANRTIIMNAEDYHFTYYSSISDLKKSINELATLYNSIGGETLYVKVEDPQTGCYAIAELELFVSRITSTSGSVEQMSCESDDDGFTTFNLVKNNAAILNLIKGTSVTYYTSLSDADLQQNKLPENYTNTIAYHQTIYAKVKEGTICKGLVELNLVVIQNPTLNVDKKVFICKGEKVVLDAGENYFSYEWSTGQTTQQITVKKQGNYTITVYNENGCSTTKEIIVKNYEDAVLIDLITGQDYLEAIIKNASEYTYSIDGINFQSNPRFTGIKNGIYTIYVKSLQGCVTTLDTIGFITQDVIANVFTPNGDGFNDYWIVEGLDAFPKATVQVFSREGKEVLKRAVGDGFSWDGKFLGRSLPSNDYWYIIKLPDGKVFRNHLTIKNR
ncbi:MAG: choice-of-anchor L domain-containing protein [Flavobacteriales bacterium]